MGSKGGGKGGEGGTMRLGSSPDELPPQWSMGDFGGGRGENWVELLGPSVQDT